jgi:hypothetical protein
VLHCSVHVQVWLSCFLYQYNAVAFVVVRVIMWWASTCKIFPACDAPLGAFSGLEINFSLPVAHCSVCRWSEGVD